MTPAHRRKIELLLTEWEDEVKEHGIWTSGHSIAKEMAKHLRALLASSSVAPSETPGAVWRPIETAPKDEQRVMLFNPDESMGSWAFQTGGYYEELGGWQYDGQNPRYSNAHPPTHWMPLPAPPTRAQETER